MTSSSTTIDAAMMRRALALAAHGPPPTPTHVSAACSWRPRARSSPGLAPRRGHPARRGGRAGARGRAARGATAYVTLEPCNHTGRTEPCAEALYAAGVARVVFAQTDPNPTAAGGATWLRDGASRSRAACWPTRRAR